MALYRKVWIEFQGICNTYQPPCRRQESNPHTPILCVLPHRCRNSLPITGEWPPGRDPGTSMLPALPGVSVASWPIGSVPDLRIAPMVIFRHVMFNRPRSSTLQIQSRGRDQRVPVHTPSLSQSAGRGGRLAVWHRWQQLPGQHDLAVMGVPHHRAMTM